MKQKIIISLGLVFALFVVVLLFKASFKRQGEEIMAQQTNQASGILQDSEMETLRVLAADVTRIAKQSAQLQDALQAQANETKLQLRKLETQLKEKPKNEVLQNNEVSRAAAPVSRFATVHDKEGRVTDPIDVLLDKEKEAVIRNAPKPAYTLPIGTKLLDATTFDVLIGRIPVKGKVADPYPFSVILSSDNLAANGHRIPGISHAIATGTVVGDFNLTCARADIYTFTFVFEDGTISQIENNAKLGYLSNDIGAGCISGVFVSDATKYILGQIGMSAAQGAATALSESQVTHNSSGYQTESFISGSTGKFILGEGIDSGMAESKKWLADRLESSFDAIVVPQGQNVNITLTKMLEIDYNPEGRKVNYDYEVAAHHYYLD